mmetsp:Transcript_33976/g.83503  ORF Transcript_33976/g.83503 Transcript_33976/m.83503 type:complete len:207 (-) Transcript_33976:3046-3666(-)
MPGRGGPKPTSAEMTVSGLRSLATCLLSRLLRGSASEASATSSPESGLSPLAMRPPAAPLFFWPDLDEAPRSMVPVEAASGRLCPGPGGPKPTSAEMANAPSSLGASLGSDEAVSSETLGFFLEAKPSFDVSQPVSELSFASVSSPVSALPFDLPAFCLPEAPTSPAPTSSTDCDETPSSSPAPAPPAPLLTPGRGAPKPTDASSS